MEYVKSLLRPFWDWGPGELIVLMVILPCSVVWFELRDMNTLFIIRKYTYHQCQRPPP